MFFMILGTYRNQTFIDFSPAQRIQLMIFLCHTVTHGTDLRRSPLECDLKSGMPAEVEMYKNG